MKKKKIEEFKYDDIQSTFKVTQEETMATANVFYVPVDVHNSSPADDGENSQNQLYMQNVQSVRNNLDKEKIATEGNNRSLNDTRCKIIKKCTKVNFSDKVQIKYYEIDSWDNSNSNGEHTETSGEIF